MSVLALLVLLLSSWQDVSAQVRCTKADLCKPVNANVCDNSKCLVVNQLQINMINLKIPRIHDWNILRPPFTNNCPFNVKFIPQPGANRAVTATFTTFSGFGCLTRESVSRVFTSDIDPRFGNIRLLTTDIGGLTLQDCFTHFQPGLGYVYRRCIVDRSNTPCAAIYSVEAPLHFLQKAILHLYLKRLGVDMSKTVAQCVA